MIDDFPRFTEITSVQNLALIHFALIFINLNLVYHF